ALALAASQARAQVDTLDFGNLDFSNPAVASLPLGDIVPPYGVVHAAWYRGTVRTLVHAWKYPGGWQTETVADSAGQPDLALHGDGLPSLAWFDTRNRLIYGERSSGGWSRDTVATYPGATRVPSLVLGPEPALAYLAGPSTGPTALNYARRSGST